MLDAHYNLANALFDLGKYALAARHYKIALEINPQFEKAVAGLRDAETARRRNLHAERSNGDATEAPLPSRSPRPQGRTLDPLEDALFLSAMHTATMDAEKQARVLLQILESELLPAISALLKGEKQPDAPKPIRQLETALQNLHVPRRQIQSVLKRLRRLGEHSPATAIAV